MTKTSMFIFQYVGTIAQMFAGYMEMAELSKSTGLYEISQEKSTGPLGCPNNAAAHVQYLLNWYICFLYESPD